MNKSYYKRLCREWFDAALSPREERRLKSFLATTEDPEFDEAKAVMGYFAAGRSLSVKPVRRRPWMSILAAAAAISAIFIIGTTIRNNSLKAIDSMESTLTEFFSSGADVEGSLTALINKE